MKLWFLALLLATHLVCARTVSIIIHGTWGIESSWYLPGGEFFEAYQEAAHVCADHYCCTFSWSGKNSHEARIMAAQQLSYLIESYDPATTVIIVAHSHGANVAFLASQLLGYEPTHSIDTIYALGAPINMELYAPDMKVVQQVVNFFSYRDLVQPVLGMFERQLPCNDRMINMRVLINDQQPKHSGLHAQQIAAWLPHLHAEFKQKKETFFDSSVPLLIKFYDEALPTWEVDAHRGMGLEGGVEEGFSE